MKVKIVKVTDVRSSQNKYRGIIGNVVDLALGKTASMHNDETSIKAHTSNIEEVKIVGDRIAVTTMNTIYVMELV
jgi:hypothetical protein